MKLDAHDNPRPVSMLRTRRHSVQSILNLEEAYARGAPRRSIARTRQTVRRACDLDRWIRHRPILTASAGVLAGAAVAGVFIRAFRGRPVSNDERESGGFLARLGGFAWTAAIGAVRIALLNRVAIGPEAGLPAEAPSAAEPDALDGHFDA